MRATLKLLNTYFWKTFYGPILAFIFPALLLTIMGNILRIEYVFPGIIALTSLFIAVQAMPLGLMELKNSTLFKYIGSTPVNPKRFIVASILYYVFIDFLAIVVLMIAAAIIFHNKVFPSGELFNGKQEAVRHLSFVQDSLYSGIFTPMGFFSFVCANSLHVIFALAVGIAIATFSKTPQQALTIALLIIIPTMFLSGMILSVDIIAQSNTMQLVSRLVPFRYTTGNIIVASTPVNQLGNLMDVLSLENKKLIFNIVGRITNELDANSNHIIQFFKDPSAAGVIITQDRTSFIQTSDINLRGTSQTNTLLQSFTWKSGRNIYNIFDIKNTLQSLMKNGTEAQLKTFKTFWFAGNDSTLFKRIFLVDGAMTGSDNNMFRWYSAFGVRKVPSISAVQAFMTAFFKGESTDPSRFTMIWENNIQKNDFGFINLFTKQNVALYTIAERILNTILPTLLSIGLVWISIRNFKWSAR